MPLAAERIVIMSPTHSWALRVPVTARLSKRFYDVLGEDIANELVDWFNAVDLTYRTDLRELNELNFARFDAKLEQRLAELRAELLTEDHHVECGFDGLGSGRRAQDALSGSHLAGAQTIGFRHLAIACARALGSRHGKSLCMYSANMCTYIPRHHPKAKRSARDPVIQIASVGDRARPPLIQGLRGPRACPPASYRR
jgi:hypothetical protein